MMRGMTRLWIAVILGMSAQSPVRADVLELNNKRAIEGIIVQEDGSRLKTRVAWQGYVTIDRQDVVAIIRSDARAHEQLLAAWREEFQADQQREQAQKDFESSQQAKGLVKYQGEWIASEELLAIRARKEEQQERKQLEDQLNQLAQRVLVLTEENQQLRQALLFARQQAVIFTHPVRMHREREHTLFRDEQGHLIRVQEDGSRTFTGGKDLI